MAPPARPNLRQIANSLGLSVTTVSRALKEGPEVHPRTRARVQKAAAKAGYAPNIHGLALRTGRTRTIAAILPLETRAYVADLAKVPLIEGMTLAASENGYALSIFSTGPEEDQLWSRGAGSPAPQSMSRAASRRPATPTCGARATRRRRG